MKSHILPLFLLISSFSFCQSDSVSVAEDTSNIYVINSTNRLIKVGDDYSIEFRDLKRLTEVHYIRFESKEAVQKFFTDCYRVLDQDATISNSLYTLNRNMLSRNVVRIEHDDEAYFLLAYGTLEKMEKAFKRYATD
ncbi:MAG: hypothetical protein ACFHU9_11815 [Fluviicola sp.]